MIDRIEQETRTALAEKKMEAALAKDGLELPPATQTRAQFAAAVRKEHAFWAAKVKELDIKFE